MKCILCNDLSTYIHQTKGRLTWGAFNNYGDKIREGGGQKMSVFVMVQNLSTQGGGPGGQKIAKFCPRSC